MQAEWYIKNKELAIEKSKKWYKENKEKAAINTRKRREKSIVILNRVKINGCAICGYNKCTRSLNFHHVNPKDKNFNCNIDGLMQHINKDYVDELNKCILLCANCHGEVHSNENGD